MIVDRAGIEGVDWSDGDVGRCGSNGGVMPAAGVRNMMYRGKLTGLIAGMSLLSGERLEEAKRTAESLGSNRVVGAAIVFSAICLFLSSLFSDKRASFGLMVAAVIIAVLAYANRRPIRMYIKAKWDPGHCNPR